MDLLKFANEIIELKKEHENYKNEIIKIIHETDILIAEADKKKEKPDNYYFIVGLNNILKELINSK